MYSFKKSLFLLIIGIMIFELTGCSRNANKTETASVKVNKETTVENDNSINLNKIAFLLPEDLSKRGNENEIFFDNENKQTIGGISLIGYYGNYILPNHSKILDSEDIDVSLGKGKLFTLNRSNPAASSNTETWNELHAIIPAHKNNLAYDIWLIGKKEMLLNILKSLKVEVVINSEINKYSLSMSSVPGIPLNAEFKANIKEENIKFHWITEKGTFLNWHQDNGQINILGKNIITNEHKIYWSVEPNEKLKESNFKIYLKIEDKNSSKVICETSIQIVQNKEGVFSIE